MPFRAKPLAQPPLLTTLVRGIPIDISETTIHYFIYGLTHDQLINTTKNDYQMGIVRRGTFMWDPEQRHGLLDGWIATLLMRERALSGGDIVSVWHCDKLIEVTKIVDLGLIKDDANLASPKKGIDVDLPHLGDAIIVDVEQFGVERANDDTTTA
uniref:Integrase core domain containing protein n=1 Tax=Solanum tuberosum TaxID=4113 RepID=M1DTU0_SOLTU